MCPVLWADVAPKLPSLFSTASGGESRCEICGASYKYKRNLTEHMKRHSGQTRCPVCGQELSDVHTMRKHMVRMHGIPRKEVDKITNKRRTVMEYLAQVDQWEESAWNPGDARWLWSVWWAVERRRRFFRYFESCWRSLRCAVVLCVVL